MTGRLSCLIALLTVATILTAPQAARAASPAEICRHVGTDDRLREIPLSLVPTAERLFGIHAMPATQVQRSTFFRCFESRVLVCNFGANLPCGKANTSPDLPGANVWCAKNPGSDSIPMYVTGHDTIYGWRCDGPLAAITATLFHVDPRGFIARFWKPADP